MRWALDMDLDDRWVFTETMRTAVMNNDSGCCSCDKERTFDHCKVSRTLRSFVRHAPNRCVQEL
eukprot:5390436-Amphidinium_carterae.1